MWREGEIFHQRISLDDFIDDTFQRAETFIKLVILPELIGKLKILFRYKKLLQGILIHLKVYQTDAEIYGKVSHG